MKPPATTWEVAILKCYAEYGGSATNEQIYKKVGDFIALTPQHLRTTVHGGRPAYVHQVRSHIANLVQGGDLKKLRVGEHDLTAKGKSRITP